MAKDLKKLSVSPEVKADLEAFNKNVDSKMDYESSFSGSLMRFDWVDEILENCPYIDRIVKYAKIALVQVENTCEIDKAKRTGVESVKDLAHHTEYIDEVDENQEIKPNKILEIRSEETFKTYENKFLYTLVNQLEKFVYRKEELLDKFEFSSTKDLEFMTTTKTESEAVKVELHVECETLPNNNIDKKLQDEINQVKAKIKNIKEYLGSWRKSDMMKELTAANTPFVTPPLKKTNIFLKNPNFKLAIKVWEFINNYDYNNDDNSSENLESKGDEILKGFLNHSALIDYYVTDAVHKLSSQQTKKMSEYALSLVTDEINRIMDLLNSLGIDITTEELLKLIAENLKANSGGDGKNRNSGAEDVKKKFLSAIEEYNKKLEEIL